MARLRTLVKTLWNAEPSGKSSEGTRRMGNPSKVLESETILNPFSSEVKPLNGAFGVVGGRDVGARLCFWEKRNSF